ncbi:MAG: endonuclease/exonuclease/phosphatase family protein [Pseudomonadota bacterium]
MRVATFNLQSLRLRRGPQGAHLDGARDADVPQDRGPEAEALDDADRRLTAKVLREADADLVALQEVFDRATLDHFHDRFLVPSGAQAYPHRVCRPGNDGRGLDVAVMSRLPLSRAESHAGETPRSLGLEPMGGVGADQPVFRRDCLEVEAGGLSLFVCHFKAPYPDAEAAWPVRRLEALAARRLVERRFADPARALWLILGDLNEPGEETGERAVAPLLDGFSEDLMLRLPEGARWSFHQPFSQVYSRPDAMLASPALAARFPEARPEVLRMGLEREAARHDGPRLPGVGEHRPHASDHAAVAIEFPGL